MENWSPLHKTLYWICIAPLMIVTLAFLGIILVAPWLGMLAGNLVP